MRMIEIDYEARPPIDGYGPGGFRIGGTWIDGSVILLPGGQHGFEPTDAGDVLAQILAEGDTLDVLLIGMGGDIRALPSAWKPLLADAPFGHDLMNTPSACRTYNVLLTENRRVGALLIAV